MRTCARTVALFVLLAQSLSNFVIAQTSTVRVATGVSRPVFAVALPGDTSRLFIAEQHTGRIEIMDLGSGTISPTPFLDLSGLSTGNEQGLLGLAFDPDYANNGFFYVNVTTSADGGDTHIRRYLAQGDPLTSNTASLASQFEILSFNQPQGNHNGGWIDFGPNDGYLYIATGDGGGSDDNDGGHTAGSGNSQDITNNLLGKMLRIDVAGDDFPADASRNYAVPGDNPFVNATGDDEIWAYGLRNPYRSSFDRANGDLWIGDVGQAFREEIDYQRADSAGGENYGWRLREGTIATPTGNPPVGGAPPPGNVEPIYDYSHGGGAFQGNVVTGGYVYRGPVAAWQGHYFFADFGSDNIWKLDPEAISPRNSVTRVNDLLGPDAGVLGNISSFGEDSDGNLFLVRIGDIDPQTFQIVPNTGEIFLITTASQDAVWNGNDPTAGNPGNGDRWDSASNWTRGGTVDQLIVDEDHAIFVAGSSVSLIDLAGDHTVSAVTFKADYTLANNTLRVLSGNLAVDSSITATIASTLEAESADHSLRKLGNGSLLIEGTAGQIVVREGTLGGNGTVDYLTVRDGATVAPGASIGALNVDNDFVMEAGATLAIEVGGTATGDFDQLLVDGVALLDGTLDVSLVNSYVPQAGDSIPFLVAQGGAGGIFDTLDLPTLGPNLEWLLNPGGITTFLLVNSTLDADFDNDGDVDQDDLAAWEAGLGTTGGAGRSDGDADGDFDVDGADFLFWQRQHGIGAPLASSQSAPEPATLLLSLGVLLAQLAGRRRTN